MPRFAMAAAFLGLLPALAAAQTQVSGTITATGLIPPTVSFEIKFSCTGAPTCTGTHNSVFIRSDCPNPFVLPGAMTLTIDTTLPPGPMPLNFRFFSGGPHIAGPPSCTVISSLEHQIIVTGTWNGSTGTFVPGPTVHNGTFTVTTASPPVFPMSVTSNIGATSASASAQVQYRPQDVGTSGSLYVFAVAPSNVVASTTATTAKEGKEGSAACVLAQLNAAGQLRAVTTTSLQAYVTGVLAAQSQAVTILNNVPTANIGGAVFYVGYGPNAAAMIANGVTQRAVSIPGAAACNPQRPQTGWWWNPAEDGRGYSIEVAGNTLFFAAYLYDASGRATWLLASGKTSLDGSLYTGSLESYAGGQSLAGPHVGATGSLGGPITLAFNDSSHGTLSWAGGNIPIERFSIVPNGLRAPTPAGQPQVGWWWNPQESGRGFFLEWQGGQLFMTGYMYDASGNPIWYLSSNTTPSANPRSYSSNWLLYGNGQTLTGTHRSPVQVNSNVAPVTITFTGPESALMTLPGGRATAITRYRF